MNPKPKACLTKSIATLLTVGVCLTESLHALPKGEQVRRGSATFDQRGSQLNIRTGKSAIIDYRSFDIGKSEKVRFIQPGKNSRVLNRVTDANPSRIFGTLEANGRVVLANPYGIFFENGSVVNVGGLIAAAGSISDKDFLAGRYSFDLTGDVVNRGSISAIDGVGLYGTAVSNEGSITSQAGTVSMVAGDSVFVGEADGNIFANSTSSIPKAKAVTGKAAVRNSGTIKAPKVFLAAGDVYGLAIAQSGTIIGQDITLQAGKTGTVTVSGRVDASNRNRGGKGGKVKFSGGHVVLRDANVDASGDAGGGEILIGGDYQGGGLMLRAETTLVDAGSTITADALTSGSGGKVVVWADGTADFAGRIFARGGAAGGDGGLVETSGKAVLHVTGSVDAGAPAGAAGSWLLDPHELQITNASGTQIPEIPVNSGTFTSSDGASVIAPATILAALNRPAPTNVILQTDVDGLGIRVVNGFDYTGATAATLSLIAPTGYVQFEDTISGANLNLTIRAGGNISAAATFTGNAVVVGGLLLEGANVDLTGDATTLAGRATGTFKFTDTNALVIGAVNDHNNLLVSGIQANGVTISAVGALAVNHPIASGTGPMGLTGSAIITAAPGLDLGGLLSATNQPIALRADALTLQATVNAGTGLVSIRPVANLPVNLGVASVLGVSLGLPQGTLNFIKAGQLQIGALDGYAGAIRVEAPIPTMADWNSLALLTAGAISADPPNTLTVQSLHLEGSSVSLLSGEVGTLSGRADGAFTFGGDTDGFTVANPGIQAQGVTLQVNTVFNGQAPLVVNAPIDAGSGLLSLTAGTIRTAAAGTLETTDNAIGLTANRIEIEAGVDAGTNGGVVFRPGTNLPIDLVETGAPADAGRLLIHQSSLNHITAGLVTIGSITPPNPHSTGITIKAVIAGGTGPTPTTANWNRLALLTTGDVGTFGFGVLNVGELRVEGANINLTGDVTRLAGKATGTFAFSDPATGLTIGAVDGLAGIGAVNGVTLVAGGALVVGLAAPVVSDNGPVALTGGSIRIDSHVHALGGAVTLTAPAIALNHASAPAAGVVSARDGIRFTGPTVTGNETPTAIALSAHSVITSLGDIVFNGTIDGTTEDYTQNLTVRTTDALKTITFHGLIGNGIKLGDIVLEAGREVTFTDRIDAETATGAAISAQSLEITGPTVFDVQRSSFPGFFHTPLEALVHPTVRTRGAQQYRTRVKLESNAFFWSETSAIVFAPGGAVLDAGGYDLAVKFAATPANPFLDVSNVAFSGIQNFSADGPVRLGLIDPGFGFPDFSTVGFQSYQGSVTLADPVGDPLTARVIEVRAGRIGEAQPKDIAFWGTVDSQTVGAERSLTVSGFTLSTPVNAYFLGAVGGNRRDGTAGEPVRKDGSVFSQSSGVAGARLRDLTVAGTAHFGYTPPGGQPLATEVSINTIGDQTYGKALLDADTTLIAAKLTFDAANTYDIASLTPPARHDLGLFVGAGEVMLPKIDPLALNSIAVGGRNVGFGNVIIKTSGVVTAGAQVYFGDVVLTDHATFQAGVAIPGGAPGQQNSFGWAHNLGLAFLGTIGGEGGSWNLALNTNGTTLLHDRVGATGIASLTTDAGGQTILDIASVTGADISVSHPTAGNITFGDAVILCQDTVLSATGNVIFGKTVDNDGAAPARALTVQAAGFTRFVGDVGLAQRLGSVTTDQPGSVEFGPISVEPPTRDPIVIQTTGAQTFNDAAYLHTNVTFDSSDRGVIAFSTLDSDGTPRSALVKTGGATLFRGNVGVGSHLFTLETDAPGSVEFGTQGGGSLRVWTESYQRYGDRVLLNVDSTLTIERQGDFLFRSTVDSAGTAHSLTLTSPSVANAAFFEGSVGGEFRTVGTLDSLSKGGGLFEQISRGLDTRLQDLTVEVPAYLGQPGGTPGVDTQTLFVNTIGQQDWYRLNVGVPPALRDPAGPMRDVAATFVARDLKIRNPADPANEIPTHTTADLTLFVDRFGGAATLPKLADDAFRNLVVGSFETGIGRTSHFTTGYVTTGSQVFWSDLRLPADSFFYAGIGGPGVYRQPPAGPPFTAFNGLAFLGQINAANATQPYPTLALNTPGDTLLHGRIGGQLRGAIPTDPTYPLAALTSVNLLGRILIDVSGSTLTNPSIRVAANAGPTLGTITFNNPVVLCEDTVLQSTGRGDITFNATVDSALVGSERSLSVLTGGITRFGNGEADFVGGQVRLASLTTDDDAAADWNGTNGERTVFDILGGTNSVRTAGYQTYEDAVTLVRDTVLRSNGGDIAFRSTVDTAELGATAELRRLTVNTPGGTLFGDGGLDFVGATRELESLTTDAPGVTTFDILGGTNSVRTAGYQTYEDAVTLEQNTVLTSNSGNIAFQSTVDTAALAAVFRRLAVNTPGATLFGDGGLDFVGATRELESLTTDAPGVTTFDILGGANSVRTAGYQTYQDAVTLVQDTVLRSNGGNIAFQSTVDSDALAAVFRRLAVNTPGATLFGDGGLDFVGATRELESLTTDAPGVTTFDILGGANSVRTAGYQTYQDAVTLVQDTVLRSNGGDIWFRSTVDTAELGATAELRRLAVNTPEGTLFGDGGLDSVGATRELESLTTDAPGVTTFDILGGTNSVWTAGYQTYQDAVTLVQDTVLRSNSGNIAFRSTVDTAELGATAELRRLTVNTPEATLFGDGGADFVGSYRPLASLTTDNDAAADWHQVPGSNPAVFAGERTVFNIATPEDADPLTNSVRTSEAQTYGDAVVLALDTELRSTALGEIAFNSTVTGVPYRLEVKTDGLTDFNGVVSVRSLGTDAGGLTRFDMTAGAEAGVTTTEFVRIDDPISFNVTDGRTPLATKLSVLSGGPQTYSGAATLEKDTVLTSDSDPIAVGVQGSAPGNDIVFNATVNSALAGSERSLLVNTGGVTVFGNGEADNVGGVIPLASLTTDDAEAANWDGVSGERTVFNILGGANSVRTTGAQTYGDAVVLALDTELRSTGLDEIAFNSTVDSAVAGGERSLTVDTGGVTRFGNGGADYVGGLVRLASLTTDDDAAADWNQVPGSNPAVFAGERTVFDIRGGSNSVWTTQVQTYHDAVTLMQDTVLRSNGGDIWFRSTVDTDTLAREGLVEAYRRLTVHTPASTLFGDGGGDFVGFNRSLLSLTTDDDAAAINWRRTSADGVTPEVFAGERTTFDIDPQNDANGEPTRVSVLTAGYQTYEDAVTLMQNTVLTSTSGNIAFQSTADTAALAAVFRRLAVNTPGATLFGNGGPDYVGGTRALASVTTDAPGVTTFDIDPQNDANGEPTRVSVLTAGYQTYEDAVTLMQNTVLTSTSGNIAFQSTADTAALAAVFRRLAVNTPGATLFGNGGPDYVGGTRALASVTTDAPGVTTFDIDPQNDANGEPTRVSVLTAGYQTYEDAVTLMQNTVLTSTSGNIAFQSTADTAALAAVFRRLAVNTPGATLFGNGGPDYVGGTRALASVTTDAPGVTTFDIDPQNDANGEPTRVSVLTAGYQTYEDAVTLMQNTVLTSTSGNIAFQSTADTAALAAVFRRLAVNTPGATLFGNGGPDYVGGTRALASVTTDAPGVTTFDIDPQNDANGEPTRVSVLTAGYQTYEDAVTLKLNTVLTTSTRDIAFLSTVDSAAKDSERSLKINSVGATKFGDGIGEDLVGFTFALASLKTDASGATTFNIKTPAGKNSVRTTGAQTYGDAVVLDQYTTLTSIGTKTGTTTEYGDITFSSTVDGLGGVNVETGGDTIFTLRVGSNKPLASLETDPAGRTVLLGGFEPIKNTKGETIDFSTTVTATGNIIFRDLLSDRDAGGVGQGVFVRSTGGTVSIQDNANLKNLRVESPKVTLGRAGNPSTISTGASKDKITGQDKYTGPQTYTGAVEVAGEVTLNLLKGTFNSTVDGPGQLTVMASGDALGTLADVTFTGAIGADAPLEKLTVTGGILKLAEAHATKLLNLDATKLLDLTGSTYEATSGDVLFNPTARLATPDATILSRTGSVSIIAGKKFTMGAEQKLLVNAGALSIRASQATLGDLAASVSLTVDVGSVGLLGRPESGFTNNSREDLGLSIVSPVINFGNTQVSFGGGSRANVAVFATKNTTPVVQRSVAGISFVTEDDLGGQFGNAGSDTLVGSLLQPIANGERINETNQSTTPVIVDRPRPDSIEQLGSLSAATLAILREMGISPRLATSEEEYNVGLERGVFSQPIEGKSEMLPDDYKVVVLRLSEDEVQAIVDEYKKLAGADSERLRKLADDLAAQNTKYMASLPPPKDDEIAPVAGVLVEKFAAWMQGAKATDAKVQEVQDDLGRLANILDKLPAIGLTKKEVELCKNRILGVLASSLGLPEPRLVMPLLGRAVEVRKESAVALPPQPPAEGTAVPFSETPFQLQQSADPAAMPLETGAPPAPVPTPDAGTPPASASQAAPADLVGPPAPPAAPDAGAMPPPSSPAAGGPPAPGAGAAAPAAPLASPMPPAGLEPTPIPTPPATPPDAAAAGAAPAQPVAQ